jgi:hypothetical protein
MAINSLPVAKKNRRKLRWYQCSPPALLLLGLLVVVGIGCVAVTIQDGRKQKAAAETIQKLGGTVESKSMLLGKLLGSDSLVTVTSVVFPSQSTTDAELERLQGLSRLQSLWLSGTNVTDAGLAHLRGLSQLQDLRLDKTRITDAGLLNLRKLNNLQSLWLHNTNVTDAGLLYLEGLTQLQSLWLHKTEVTDQGVKKLQQALPNCSIRR